MISFCIWKNMVYTWCIVGELGATKFLVASILHLCSIKNLFRSQQISSSLYHSWNNKTIKISSNCVAFDRNLTYNVNSICTIFFLKLLLQFKYKYKNHQINLLSKDFHVNNNFKILIRLVFPFHFKERGKPVKALSTANTSRILFKCYNKFSKEYSCYFINLSPILAVEFEFPLSPRRLEE